MLVLQTFPCLPFSPAFANESVSDLANVAAKDSPEKSQSNDFDWKRKDLETRIASIEKRGVNAKPYHQALAEIVELYEKKADSKIVDDKITRLLNAVDSQILDLDYRDGPRNLGPFKPAKISPSTPVELYCEKLNPILRKSWNKPVTEKEGASAYFTIDSTGKISDVKLHRKFSEGGAANQSRFETFLRNQKPLPPPPQDSAPLTLVAMQTVEDTVYVIPDWEAVDFSKYMNAAQDRVRRNWRPPKGEKTKRITAFFRVNRAGELLSRRIERPGNQAEDTAALRAIERASPFGPMPPGSPPDVNIQFTFDYNVWKNGQRK